MMRAVTESDLPAVRAFLRQRPEQAMFPLSNLDNYGLAKGDDADALYAVHQWVAGDDTGIRDVLTLTAGGMLMPVLPSGDFEGARAPIAGRRIIGVIGPAADARGLMKTCGLSDCPASLNRDEPHFALDLATLTIPDGPGQIVELREDHLDPVLDWMTHYQTEALHTAPAKSREMAEASLRRGLAAGNRVVLMEGNTPLATTAFNAALPDIVQIGGVYTPPKLRGQGHARRAVALHLARARARGVRKATLFSGSDMATRAYKAIGFQRIGDWTLALFDTPEVIDG